MAVTLTTRPSVWSAVKNPVVYKFTTTGGPFVNYRIEVEVFRASDNSSLTGGIKFSFSPNSANITFADISTVVKAFLSPEWDLPNTINAAEPDTNLKVYIKYQELYDGSVTSVVDDVASPFQCVFGALQIPSTNGNNLTDYVPGSSTKKFLTVFTRTKLWRGYSGSLSVIFPDAILLASVRTQNDAAGNIIGFQNLDRFAILADDAVNRFHIHRTTLMEGNGETNFVLDSKTKTLIVQLFLEQYGAEILTNPSFVTSLSPWVNVAGAASDWVWETGDRAAVTFPIDPDAVSDPLRQDISSQTSGWHLITVNVITDNVSQTLKARAYIGSVLVKEVLNVIYAASTPESTTFNYLVYIPGSFDRIECIASGSHISEVKTFRLANFSLKREAYLSQTEALTFDVEDPCDNPVFLLWKNSLGGDAFWLFEHGQEVGYNYSGSKKANRMTLFAEHLTLNQWEALNELNTLGEVYSQNIQEFTTAINKTSIRDGSQVYIIDTSGNRTGVIVIPTNSVINTKDEVHSIEIEIELPEKL